MQIPDRADAASSQIADLDLTGFRQFKGEKSWQAVAEMLLNVYITPKTSTTPVSVQVGGVMGADSPAFKPQRSANVALAIKF